MGLHRTRRGYAVLEIPFARVRGGRRHNHVDALVFNEHEAILAEFKRAWTPSHWEWLAEDLTRLREPGCREIFEGFNDEHQRQLLFFLGADCWRLETAEAWKTGVQAKRWKVPDLLRDAHRDYIVVYKGKGDDWDGYYLTWALLRA